MRTTAVDRGNIGDRILAWRDGLLTSEGFRRLALRWPLLRSLARRRARDTFDLCAGFVYSPILLACVRLGLLERLAERPRDLAALAADIAMAPEAVERLLRAAIALRLVEPRRGGRFGLGPLGAAVVGNRAVEAMIEHNALLYADLADPVELLRGRGSARHASTAMSRYWPYATTDDPRALSGPEVAEYSRLMTTSQTLVASQILDAYPVDRHVRLLDVGGGEGGFLMAAAARAPSLRLALFDLPAVAERARLRFAEHGLTQRSEVHGGDFLRDALPSGADLVTTVRILHDHDDAAVRRLLGSIRQAIVDGGTLLVAEPMSRASSAERVGDAYFAFYLLAMGSGRARTAEELRALLEEAGFDQITELSTDLPLQAGLLRARAGRIKSSGMRSRNEARRA